MRPFSQWLLDSWAVYRRRWGALLATAGTAGAAALVGGFLPFLPAGLLTSAGVGPAWAVWGTASLVALLAVLWLSTWAQAAVTRAALSSDGPADCLRLGWSRTGAFGWVLTLTLLAMAGGWYLLLLPGLLLSELFFLAPMLVMAGEAEGVDALALSWARVHPRLGPVAGRLVVAAVVAAAPGWIPYVGWIVAMFWSPIGLVLLAGVESDLRAADPAPARPSWIGPLVGALSVVFVAGSVLAGWAAARGAQAAYDAVGGAAGLSARVRPESAQAYMEALGRGDQEGARRALDEVVSELRSAPAVEVSTTAVLGGVP